MTLYRFHSVSAPVAFVVVIVALVAAPLAADTAILRVEGDAGAAAPPNMGDGWGPSAYRYLQDAIADAHALVTDPTNGIDDAEIWVAATSPEQPYRPDRTAEFPGGTGDRAASFRLYSNVRLYGGFRGSACANGGETARQERRPQLHRTVLSGALGSLEAGDPIFSFHVVDGGGAAPSALLSGFTVSFGRAVGTAYLDQRGGGMIVSFGSPTITRCLVEGNLAADFGGAVYVAAFGHPRFWNCVIRANDAPTGGGIAAAPGSSVVLVNSIIASNTAVVTGGLHVEEGATATLTNCTVADNHASVVNAGIINGGQLVLRNSIVWGNALDSGAIGELVQVGGVGAFDIMHTCIHNLTTFSLPGSGNIGFDPVFVAAPVGDYRLECGSPCADIGDASAVPDDLADVNDDGITAGQPAPDLRLYYRVLAGGADLGAYEGGVNGASSCCDGDLDDDGAISISDLPMLLADWGFGPSAADIRPPCQGDGYVNIVDLLAMLSNWSDDCATCSGGSPPGSVFECLVQSGDPIEQISCIEMLVELGLAP